MLQHCDNNFRIEIDIKDIKDIKELIIKNQKIIIWLRNNIDTSR